MPTITSQSQIEESPCYVCSNDRFMSGWGPAKGKINTVILPCESTDEAKRVMANAKARGDQKYVRICYSKPSLRNRTHLYSYHTKDDYSRWYE